MTSKATLKLKFLGWYKTAQAADADIDFEEASKSLETSVSTLKRWVKEFKAEAEAGTIIDIIDADIAILDKAVELVEGDAAFDVDEFGNIIKLEPEVVETTEVRHHPASKTLVAFKDRVTGLDALKSEVQGAAGIATTQILKAINDSETTPAELAKLTKALTDIQMAFFNKQQTTIQVANVTTDSTSMLGSFQNKMRN